MGFWGSVAALPLIYVSLKKKPPQTLGAELNATT
jgi:hypothetical protein